MPEPTPTGPADAAAVEQRLRDAIISGELVAGETYTQAVLGERLSCGRTPLREGLRTLTRERLVVGEPNKRIRIAPLTAGDAEQLYAMRIALEAIAVRLTVPRLRSSDLARLEGHLAEMDHYVRTEDAWGFRTPHRAFHALLVGGAGERIIDQIALLSDHGERYRVRFGAGEPTAWTDRRDEHRAILDAVVAGDADATAQRLVKHYTRAATVIIDQLGGPDDPERIATSAGLVLPAIRESPRAPAAPPPSR